MLVVVPVHVPILFLCINKITPSVSSPLSPVILFHTDPDVFFGLGQRQLHNLHTLSPFQLELQWLLVLMLLQTKVLKLFIDIFPQSKLPHGCLNDKISYYNL